DPSRNRVVMSPSSGVLPHHPIIATPLEIRRSPEAATAHTAASRSRTGLRASPVAWAPSPSISRSRSMSDERSRGDDPLSTPATGPGPASSSAAEDSEAVSAAAGAPAEEENPWASFAPWKGKAAPLDKILLVLIIGVPFIYLGLMPFRPWML